MREQEKLKKAPIAWAASLQLFGSAVEYATDLVQRQILFWDTLGVYATRGVYARRRFQANRGKLR